MRAFRQRFFAWIAIVAMMVSALAPAISRAMGPDESGRYLIEVCSAAGTHRISLTAEEAAFYGELASPAGDGEGGDVPILDHCPYCSASFNLAMLPPADAALLFAVSNSQSAPRLFFVSPRPLFAWSPAHPRAPPAHV